MRNLEKINKQEVFRYLGAKGGEMSDSIMKMVDLCIQKVIENDRSRYVYKEFPLRSQNGSLYLEGTSFHLQGMDIGRLLKECHSVLLIAVTLTEAADRWIRREQIKDMARAVVMDACCSVAVEAVCDQVQADLAEVYEKKGRYLTDRFSPGYGDMPLNQQADVIDALDANRRIGLTLSESHLLIPTKSITGIVGIANSPQPQKIRGCAFCLMKNHCVYRKKGVRCYE